VGLLVGVGEGLHGAEADVEADGRGVGRVGDLHGRSFGLAVEEALAGLLLRRRSWTVPVFRSAEVR
jgi:hypothetical protein